MRAIGGQTSSRFLSRFRSGIRKKQEQLAGELKDLPVDTNIAVIRIQGQDLWDLKICGI
jgi:hypothetical protein